ncbi:MAG: 50S ribosomal protein L11 methyltransferase [Bdellovibrionales bacterium]|nr:50S ribosomal protein L11 methyltransferase [Bdellovibrionales bacterium]
MIYALSFELNAQVARTSDPSGSMHPREVVLARFNDFCSDLKIPESGEFSFCGVTEGVLLAEEAHARGYETESWVLDEGLAPHERDWLSHESCLKMLAYFHDEISANAARDWLFREYIISASARVIAEEEQDWNATWKAAFTGIEVNDRLKVLPPWSEEWVRARESKNTAGIIAINPGAGFGTGTHETTQLCLKILTGLGDLSGKVVLDFGSGSGILGIAAALQGARVYCVEVDPLANENAKENAELNGVLERVTFSEAIPSELRKGQVDVLLANILRPILIRFSSEIKACLGADAELVLSGLIESDLLEVIEAYQSGGNRFSVIKDQKNEWRSLWLRRGEG